ncbi:MAG: YtxH domain-containing protein [Thermoleophilia bacterium]|nr:YtxH domain-containing protein [Thermoleophilia bacterium]
MLIGMVLGLMLAPRPGTETIEQIREKLLRNLPA